MSKTRMQAWGNTDGGDTLAGCDVRLFGSGRIRTLAQTAEIINRAHPEAQPINPVTVLRIERRALAKLRESLAGLN